MSETRLWQHIHAYNQRERYSHSQKVSFSPSSFLQNLFLRNRSRHWSFECVDIFPKHKTVLAENQALPAFSRPALMHCLKGPPVLLQPEPNLRSSLKKTPPCYVHYVILHLTSTHGFNNFFANKELFLNS